MGGGDPATACHGDTKCHLMAQPLGAMAVAVHTHVDAGGNRPPRHGAVHVEMAGGPVDLHDGARLDGCLEEPGLVECVAGPSGDETVGRMGDDLDQRMPHGCNVSIRQPRSGVRSRVVKRREDDVECLEHCVGKIERSIAKDVHFGAVQDRNPRMPFTRGRYRIALLREAIGIEPTGDGGALE